MIDPKQLKIGEQEEKEHHLSAVATKQIAMDHLKKIPDYYTRLEKMETAAPHNSISEQQNMSNNPILASIRKNNKKKDPDAAQEAAEEAKESPTEEKSESPKQEAVEEGQEDEGQKKKKKMRQFEC